MSRRAQAPGEPSRRLGLALLCVAIAAFFALRYDGFLSSDNALSISLNVSSIAIAAVGAAYLLISGNVDLSIAGQYALISVLMGKVLTSTQSVVLGIAFALALGLSLGLLNGLLVRFLRISPIIVTLAMMSVYSGIAYAVTSGEPVFGFPQAFIDIGQGKALGIPIPVIVAAVVFVAGGWWLLSSVQGLRLYAIGGNAEAARLNGVRVGPTVVGLYGFNGLLMGLVAALATARVATASPGVGVGFELDVLTAVILGGVAFAGGSGHPLGLFFGVATIGVLNAGLIFAGLEDWYQDIVKGGALLLALAADQLLLRLRERRAASAGAAGAADTTVDGAGPEAPMPLAALREGRRPHERSGAPVLAVDGVSKRYGSVTALRDASIAVHAGEVVCLLGDNGAGKSSAIKVMSGVVKPDGGDLEIDGERVVLANPGDGRRRGIETVYQGLAVAPNLSVAHNLVLGEEPRRGGLGRLLGLRDDRVASALARDRLAQLGIGLERVQDSVSALSGGQRQCVAIARALREDVRVTILDEPTAALGVGPTARVLRVVRAAADRGVGVVLITHDVETVMAIADRVVVLRLGAVVRDAPIGEVDASELVHLMAGVQLVPEPAR